MMVQSTQNQWVSGFCPPFGNLNTRKYNVSETGSVSSPSEWRGTPTLLSPLERANSSH
jgi:hypothetical protein